MELEKKLKFNLLLDIYGETLTDTMRSNMESYYNDDLSLGEIAINQNVSRNAIYSSIKQGEKELLNLEEKIGVLATFDKIKSKIEEAEKEDDIEKIKKLLSEIKEDIVNGI